MVKGEKGHNKANVAQSVDDRLHIERDNRIVKGEKGHNKANVAQSVERQSHNLEVMSSILIVRTTFTFSFIFFLLRYLSRN